MGKNAKTSSKGHRKTKAALAAGAVGSTVAAAAAYRRHNARRHHTDFGGPGAAPESTQPL